MELKIPKKAVSDAKSLAPLMFEMGRLLKRDMMGDTYSMLHVETLRFIDHAQSPSMTELADYLRASKPTVSALVDGLVEDGLVEREGDAGDRRKTLLRLSRKGGQTLSGAGKRRQLAIRRLFAPLPQKDKAELARILSFIINRAS